MSRKARKGEEFISGYVFPSDLEQRVRSRFPQLDDSGWARVQEGLREWLVCCAWRGGTVLGMPSRAVEAAWHEFITDSAAYSEFCQRAFGGYLPELPEELEAPTDDLFANTIGAWDRSLEGRGVRESVLWDLDQHLGIGSPWGLSDEQLALARKRNEEQPRHEWIIPVTSYWLLHD
ncbi:MAG TPA: hypothetical protein VMT37_00185 [Solirubrobacterales bacterium]|nr:hypothetical protein [Solirubrobacterales bacterium]